MKKVKLITALMLSKILLKLCIDSLDDAIEASGNSVLAVCISNIKRELKSSSITLDDNYKSIEENTTFFINPNDIS